MACCEAEDLNDKGTMSKAKSQLLGTNADFGTRCSPRGHIIRTGWVEMSERRNYGRMPLRCTVTLWSPHEGSVTSTTTEDLSSEGFYCLCKEPYAPGERLQAILEVPCGYWNGHEADCLVLQCDVEVVRVVLRGVEEDFGVAFRINDYIVFGDRRPKGQRNGAGGS